ncbi:MAG: hypothetical protein IKR15_05905 [Bacteroidales bacterium]|nr:hypothetical protein [Bacteroidales bacterium]
MKRSIIILAALILAASSCQKAVMENNAPQGRVRTFTASFSCLTKTSLDGLTPVWGEGDAVWFSDGVNQEIVGIRQEDIGQATAQFSTSSLTGEVIYACYPASFAIGHISGTHVIFNVPQSTDGSFRNANICVATTNDNNLSFKNATSIIRFTKETADVVSLSLICQGDNFLAGWMSFRHWDEDYIGATFHQTSSIEIDMSGPGPYYAAVYPRTMPSGSKIVMTTSTGAQYVRTINAENTLTLNKIKTFSVDAAFSGATLVSEGWAGSGTEDDPYLITSEADLKLLSNNVNNKVSYYSGVYFRQAGDISVSSFRPIGSTSNGNGFQGNYDGDSHTITINSFDLSYLSTQSANGYEVYMGLFGWVKGTSGTTPKSVIRNVRVAGTIDTGNDFVRGPHYYGSICGYATGNVLFEQCGSSLGMRLFGYYEKYPSRAKLMAAGGLVGYAAATVQIDRCYNTGNLAAYSNANSGNRFYVGGICGNLYGGLITLCYNTGNITGQMTQSGYGAFVAGIAASNTTTGSVEGCYNQGNIIAYGASSTSAKAVGITYNAQAKNCYNSGTVKSYYVGNTTTEIDYSAGISYRQSGTYQHCYYLDGCASTAMLGSGGTLTDCTYFVKGDETNGGLIEGDSARSLLDAMNSYLATVSGSEHTFYASPDADHLPVLDYVSRNILDY